MLFGFNDIDWDEGTVESVSSACGSAVGGISSVCQSVDFAVSAICSMDSLCLSLRSAVQELRGKIVAHKRALDESLSKLRNELQSEKEELNSCNPPFWASYQDEYGNTHHYWSDPDGPRREACKVRIRELEKEITRVQHIRDQAPQFESAVDSEEHRIIATSLALDRSKKALESSKRRLETTASDLGGKIENLITEGKACIEEMVKASKVEVSSCAKHVRLLPIPSVHKVNYSSQMFEPVFQFTETEKTLPEKKYKWIKKRKGSIYQIIYTSAYFEEFKKEFYEVIREDVNAEFVIAPARINNWNEFISFMDINDYHPVMNGKNFVYNALREVTFKK